MLTYPIRWISIIDEAKAACKARRLLQKKKPEPLRIPASVTLAWHRGGLRNSIHREGSALRSHNT